MDNLIDNMYRKRFNLSSVSKNNDNCIECGNYHHIACCFEGNFNVLGFGQNHYLTTTRAYTIHAERDAIDKLPFRRKKHGVNMLVLRFTKNYKLCMSKPCDKCVNNMLYLFPKKGYVIKHIYYSNFDGDIERTTLKKLSKSK